MSNYDGKIELPQTYGNEQYLSSDKSDTYLCIAEENTKQAKKIERLQEQIKEANEVIKKYSQFNNWEGDDKDQHDMTHFIGEDNGCGWEIAQDYLKKWGVK